MKEVVFTFDMLAKQELYNEEKNTYQISLSEEILPCHYNLLIDLLKIYIEGMLKYDSITIDSNTIVIFASEISSENYQYIVKLFMEDQFFHGYTLVL